MYIEPHIHMFSRTTEDYTAMYEHGIRICVEPSFWMGCNRHHAGSFFDYFSLILEFETVRARRFGVDHFAAVALNPKEADDEKLADEVISGLATFLDHPRCVALGEIGLNNITAKEESAFMRQLGIAHDRKLPVIVHLPHIEKLRGARRIIDMVRSDGISPSLIIIDHNTEETIRLSLDSGCYCGMTVYPISKLSPERVSAMIKAYGCDRMIVNGSADWGVSDPLSVAKVAQRMALDGFEQETINRVMYENPMRFYGQTPKWVPDVDLNPLSPGEFQR